MSAVENNDGEGLGKAVDKLLNRESRINEIKKTVKEVNRRFTMKYDIKAPVQETK